MTGNQHSSHIGTAGSELTMRIVRSRENPSHRIAFANEAAAEGFIAYAADPAEWGIEAVDATVDSSQSTKD